MFIISYQPQNVQVHRNLKGTELPPFEVKENGRLVRKSFLNERQEEDSLYIPDGGKLVLNPESPIDAHNIKMFKLLVANYTSVGALFKTIDQSFEKEKKRQIRAAKREAFDLVDALIASEDYQTLTALVRRLGLRKDSVTADEAKDFLDEVADTDPDFVIKTMDDPDRELRLMIETAVMKGILSRAADGMVKYGPVNGGQPIAKNDDEAVLYLKNNPTILVEIDNEINRKPIVVVAKEQPSGGPAEPNDKVVPVTAEELAEWVEKGVVQVEKGTEGKNKDKIIEYKFAHKPLGKTEKTALESINANTAFLHMIRGRAKNATIQQ